MKKKISNNFIFKSINHLDSLLNISKTIGELYYQKNLLPKIKKYEIVPPQKDKPTNILFINTTSDKGGAAKAVNEMLCKPLREKKGYKTNLLVAIDNSKEKKDYIEVLKSGNNTKQKFLSRLQKATGYQDFFAPKSFNIEYLKVFKDCDILHLHNLHGNYFSPPALPKLTALKPTVWTLHDAHALTGHCACFYDCNKWIEGCADCPDLNSYPAVQVDSTAFIWKVKRKIYENSNITYVCPSNWLKQEAQKGILKDKDIRLIPNGIDEQVFLNYDKIQARKELNLPLDKKILIFSANDGVENVQKGGVYIEQIYKHYQNRDDLVFLAIGSTKTETRTKNFINIGYIENQETLAKYYSAADLFIYPTLTDNLPFVVLESLSCGTPVISFNTGGIPEEIEHLKTGYIAKYKDFQDFIYGIELFLNDDNLRKNASIEARKTVEKRFSVGITVDNYIQLYNEIYEKMKKTL